MIPSISISDGIPTIALPLSFIMLISSLKNVYEDSKRKESDKIENTKYVNFLNDKGEFDVITWENKRVG